ADHPLQSFPANSGQRKDADTSRQRGRFWTRKTPLRGSLLRANLQLGAAYGKDIMNSVPPSDSIDIKRLAEDYVLFGQLALLGCCANVHHPLIKYRRHATSVGITSPIDQISLSLKISRFLAKSFCYAKGLEAFDPAPFCNHADYVFDCHSEDYSHQFIRMARVLRTGFGASPEIERELAFRWVLATRKPLEMIRRYLGFEFKYSAMANERRTVRNWLLRNCRKGKYVYRDDDAMSSDMEVNRSMSSMN
ncbi:MAG: hypothetical protein KGL97_19825, partial [Alphaproteobacteria bacterium]|nr:hypothetical protein [Alphaproteobacteria bacterium]